MPRLGLPEGIDRPPSGPWDYGTDEKPGDASDICVGMTIHASSGAYCLGMPGFFLSVRGRKNIGDGSHFRIDPDDLDFPTRNITKVKVFVEIDGSRITGGNFAKLQAGRGEDQLLGVFAYLKFFKE